MTKKAWQKARYGYRLFRFILSSGTRYQVHSPTLYAFINGVIRSNGKIEKQDDIEKIRQECLQSREIILKTDYGSGADALQKTEYPIEIKEIAKRSLSSARHARRLSLLVKYMDAKKILEIGTSLGISTSYLAVANPDAEIITLEGCPATSGKAKLNFQKLGLKNIRLITGRFEETLPLALEQLGAADIIFIDGNHRKDAVLDYFTKCIGYANNNTVIVVDDIHSSEGMEQAWEVMKGHEKTRVSIDLFYSGWIFMLKELSRQHFRLRYF